jgi:hypothetical protein
MKKEKDLLFLKLEAYGTSDPISFVLHGFNFGKKKIIFYLFDFFFGLCLKKKK